MRRSFLILACFLLAACDISHLQTGVESEKDPLVAAEQLEKIGKLEGAAILYQKATEKPDVAPIAYSKLAGVLRKMGRSGDAVTLLRNALAQKPGDIAIMTQLGYALIASREPQGAVTVFDELIALEPANAMHYNGKAVAFDNAGNHVAAQEIYQKALALDSDSVSIANNYAMSLILDKRYDQAIDILEPLLKKDPENMTVRQNLALAQSLRSKEPLADVVPQHPLESPDPAE